MRPRRSANPLDPSPGATGFREATARPVLPTAAILLAAAVATAALGLAVTAHPVPAQDVQTLREQAWAEIDARAGGLVDVSDRLWRLAETSLREYESAATLVSYLEAEGFTVEEGVAGMPTAFVARWGTGGPVIGILAEFDALPGISNVAEARREALAPGTGGHGCGHNLFGAGSVGAAVAAKAVLEAEGLPGSIVLYGTPAEETVIGKVYMAREGVFDDADVVLDWHPGDETGADYERSRAMNNFTVEFFGRTAHGAADPWNGRSALDAVELMNHAINLMREHLPPSIRVHYVIEDGGGAPNVVPDHASVWYYVRDLDRAGVEHAYDWILKAAEGAALATETEYEVTLATGVHSYLLNRTLVEALDRNLRLAGAPEWTEEEHAFARAIQRATDKEERGMHVGIDSLPDEEIPAQGGSTDVAEVSRIAPTAKIRVASAPLDTPWHAWPVVASGGMSIGHKAMLTAARTLAATAVELAITPELVEGATAEFRERMDGETYRSPLPAGQAPPVPDDDG
ncbi:MAG: amidohydrolase [Gemmatimonadota bacterium]